MKKILALGLTVLVLLVSLVACDNSNDPPGNENNMQNVPGGRPDTPNRPTQTMDNTTHDILDGVAMVIQDVSPSGLSFSFENSTNNEYSYGSNFVLYAFRNNSWELVEPIIENWGFTDEAYYIFPNSTTDNTAVYWEWLFGELPYGEYKFQKEILFIRSPGDFDRFAVSAEFSIS